MNRLENGLFLLSCVKTVFCILYALCWLLIVDYSCTSIIMEKYMLVFKCITHIRVSLVLVSVCWNSENANLQIRLLRFSPRLILSASNFVLLTTHFVFWLMIYIYIHSVFCLTTGPKPPLKRFLHIVRSRASSFKWEYPLLSLRSSSSYIYIYIYISQKYMFYLCYDL